ncbi:alpha/beta hydrolase family protein [Streptomyces sp. NPDC093984]|uniref:alpha/beta hydrolase family protein n=1 Tax=Streptomyces sp. NPDC093984 TaxID=3366052 RepID=UPI0037F1E9C5
MALGRRQGPLTDLCRERSPVPHIDRMDVPLLLLRGLDDVVCPPWRAEVFTRALSRHAVPYEYRSSKERGMDFAGRT